MEDVLQSKDGRFRTLYVNRAIANIFAWGAEKMRWWPVMVCVCVCVGRRGWEYPKSLSYLIEFISGQRTV